MTARVLLKKGDKLKAVQSGLFIVKGQTYVVQKDQEKQDDRLHVKADNTGSILTVQGVPTHIFEIPKSMQRARIRSRLKAIERQQRALDKEKRDLSKESAKLQHQLEKL